MIILGIESTCDETGIALVEDGRKVLFNSIASSSKLLEKFGGVVPEVAAREQVKVIIPLLREALRDFDVGQIDAMSIAYGPGLIGSLLIGVETAKAIATIWNKPLVPVNHLVGHVFSCWLDADIVPTFPLVSLIVSGGHTDIIYMKNAKSIKFLGGTLDDAAGEAFDKVARVLGLPYPGGPEIEKIAKEYKVPFEYSQGKQSIKYKVNPFPRPMINSGDFNFSFSGLKTAVVTRVNGLKLSVDEKSEIAYHFQEALAGVLVKKTFSAAEKFNVKNITVGGGVAANSRLREQFALRSEEKNKKVFFPKKIYSVDNGAMIAAAAFFNYKTRPALAVVADSSLHF